MKKILINRAPVSGPWGGGNNFVKALHAYAPKHGFNIANRLEDDIDLIFMIDPRYDDMGISVNEISRYKELTGYTIITPAKIGLAIEIMSYIPGRIPSTLQDVKKYRMVKQIS